MTNTTNPSDSYYAIFYEESVHHEGDQRSRDYPGHGYPAYTSTHTEVKKCKTEKEVQDWILSNDRYGSKKYEVVLCTPLEVTKTVVLDIKRK